MNNDDEFAAREQLAHIESDAVRRQLLSGKLANLDLTTPIRTPSTDRGKDTAHTTLRAATWLLAGIDEICGKASKFRNRSEFVRHYMVVGLALERELEGYDADMDPTVQQAVLESKAAALRALDDSIEKATDLLKHADGDSDCFETLAILSKLRSYCDQQGYTGRLRRIDHVVRIYEPR